MQTLAIFRSSDVDANAMPLDEASYKPRTAGRAIIFDGEKVALLHVANSGYYTLPGGGIDNDDLTSGLKREVMEEIGCEIEVGKEVGSAVVYFDRWKNRQVDYCYIARKSSGYRHINHTDFEASEGYTLVWAPSLEAAIALAKDTAPASVDGKLVRARDLLFLQTAKHILAA